MMFFPDEQVPKYFSPTAACVIGGFSTIAAVKASEWLSPRMVSTYKSMSVRDKAEWNSKYAERGTTFMFMFNAPVRIVAKLIKLAVDRLYCCRFAHILHAIICVLMVWTSISQTPEFSWVDGILTEEEKQKVLLANSTYSSCTFCFSMGYFIVDLVMMALYLPNVVMMVHHISGAISLWGALSSGCCHFYGLLLLSTEVTTPLICLRWLLDKAERRGTQLYLVNGVCIVITWVFSRILLFVYLFLHMLENWDVLSDFPLVVKVCLPSITVILSVLNVTWFVRIMRGVLNLLTATKHQKVKSS